MKKPRSCTATKLLALLASACAALLSATAFAGVAGTVVNLNGSLVAKKADGAVRVLTLKSVVEEGDVVATEKATYARIRFVDNSEITLRPNSQLKIDSFVFEEAKPEKDSATFSLVKGGLRAVTGALGKRNNERFGMSTPTATIGIRGTTFIVHYVPPPAVSGYANPMTGRASDLVAVGVPRDPAAGQIPDNPGLKKPVDLVPGRSPVDPVSGAVPASPASKNPVAPQSPSLPPGLHLQVTDGMIVVSNGGGSLGFSAGQFGYVPGIAQPPVIVPANPGLQFVPPPSFSSSPGPQGNAANEGDGVDCEVR